NLELWNTRQSAAGTHVDFRQTYQGIPVHRTVLSVHMAADAVTMLNGSYFPNLEIDTLPKFSAESALAAIQDDFGAGALLGEVAHGPELVLYPHGEVRQLCWLVRISSWSPLGAWEILVNAQTNQVVQKSNLIKFAEGRAVVFPENPFTTPEATVGKLNYLDESGFLRGSFARVGRFVSLTGGRVELQHDAASTNLDFFFFPDDPRFAEQNVYYHINRIHDYFKDRFGFTGRDGQIPVAVHFPDEETGGPLDNAFFEPVYQALAFGAGSGAENPGGINNPAYDADVIYHEYTHAVVDRIVQLGIEKHDLARAMGEAFADYFACTVLDDPEVGEWAFGTPNGDRSLLNLNRYPNDQFLPGTNKREEHYTGWIWGGALWDLRTALGAEVADQIIFQSLYFLPQYTADFGNGLQALIAADNVLFHGVHRLTITRKLNARGIFAVGAAPIHEVTLPVLLAPSGITGGSVLVTEMSLSNRGSESAIVEFTYTSALGSGGGTATDRLDAGAQRKIPNAIAYLREIGIDIPDSGSVAGTVLVRFSSPDCQVTAQNVVRR
ncbi:MAG: M36 family metallopeptidase, partial [Acidobacteria bacterium]|nr:M36 family metallopeptidase [Acidobacteriota bacterium]